MAHANKEEQTAPILEHSTVKNWIIKPVSNTEEIKMTQIQKLRTAAERVQLLKAGIPIKMIETLYLHENEIVINRNLESQVMRL